MDLLLERDGECIACEISVTTTVDHEVGNVAKCLKAGFGRIAVICVEEARLEKLATAVRGSLGPEAAMSVNYYKPDEFIGSLRAIQRPRQTAVEPIAERRGYKVKRTTTALSEEERRRRESEAIRMIAETMETVKK